MKKKVIDIFVPQKEASKKIGPKEGKSGEIKTKRELKSKKFWPLWLIAIFLIGGGLFLHISLSKAKVEIWPETELVSFNTKVTVEEKRDGIDFLNQVIPGISITETQTFSQDFSATGKKLIEKKAEGIVRIYNETQTDQVLIAQTRLQPPLEKFPLPLEENENPWFRTLERVVIPANGYTDVEVVADAPGEKYNIGPSTFSIPGLAGTARYTFIYGESFKPMQGGAKTEVSEVTDDDIKNAENAMKNKAFEEIPNFLRKKADIDFIVLDEAIEINIIDATTSIKTGSEVEKFPFQVKAEAKTLSFKKEDMDNFTQWFIKNQVPVDKEFDENSLDISYSLETINFDTGKLILSLNIKGKIFSSINEISFKKALSEKSLDEAQMFLQNQPGIKKSKIEFFPFWLKKIPEDLEKIEVKLNLD